MFEVIFRTLSAGDSAVPALGMGEIPAQMAAGAPPPARSISTRPVTAVDGTTAVAPTDGRSVTGRVVVVATEGPVAASSCSACRRSGRARRAVCTSRRRRAPVTDRTGRDPRRHRAPARCSTWR